MNTPICDFIQKYIDTDPLRLHMPGHKGLHDYAADITEIDGADSLYSATGIIRESEKNASSLFGCDTFYSTEGSSQCIRAMLYLACLLAAQNGQKPHILAGRNAHKTFVSTAALLDFDITWLYPSASASYLSCHVTAGDVAAALQSAEKKPCAVYITSPDYLGNMPDLQAISAVCHSCGVPLLVDNAHGAYLKFLSSSRHPLDAGADMCCDSAHKTLPVLTGGAYLHIGKNAPTLFSERAKEALALFGSTSPSYLILQSLDRINPYLQEYPEILDSFIRKTEKCKETLRAQGYTLLGDEPQKLTIDAKKYGYSGADLARLLAENNCICDFADPDFVVLMVTPETGHAGLSRLVRVLSSIPQKAEISKEAPPVCRPERVLSIRQAVFAPRRTVPVCESEGYILATENVGCPPAVPIVVAGERIDKNARSAFTYYGITHCVVCTENF